MQSSVVQYVDEDAGLTVGVGAGATEFSQHDATTNTDISKFLERPVRINTLTWFESDPVSTKTALSPWNLWATNPAVQAKLRNYAFIRGNLHVKFTINASPFYYGMMQVNYLPLQNFTPSTIIADAGQRWLIPTSQRPHILLDPQDSSGGEMILPFIHPMNFIDCGSAAAFTELGFLEYNIYSRLQSANGVSSAGASITTYAWMTDVVLSGATVEFAAQSDYVIQSDEYGQGVISKPASTVAWAAGYFEKIPIIGPFATATRIGASAISAIASLFGFTNVPVIADTEPVRPEAFPKMASSEIGFALDKLTLDPKNELSVDPRIIGLPDGTDEMMISNIAQRKSLLGIATWSTSDLTDTIMFHSRVTTHLFDMDSAVQPLVFMTPMCYMDGLFAHWRGDIIFTFKVVKSKYHKGRLRISYDPAGVSSNNIIGNVLTANIVQTVIMDIGEGGEVEFRVPYQQAAQFLRTRTDFAVGNKGWGVNSTPPTYAYDPEFDNGFITLRVLNILTAPVASSSVDILVYVRAAETIEFANPKDISSSQLSPYLAQSDVYMENIPENEVVLGDSKLAANNQYVVHFGENIRSLRQLLRRYSYHSSTYMSVAAAAASDNLTVVRKLFAKMPPTPGFCPFGTETANKIVGVGPTPYNFCEYTPLAYIMPSFLVYRGSVNWTFNTIGPGLPLNELRVIRDNTGGASPGYNSITVSGSASEYARALSLNRSAGAAGQSLTNANTNAGVNVQCPMYARQRFQSTYPLRANRVSNADGSDQDMFVLEGVIKKNMGEPITSVVINSYVGIGTDFSLHYFVNVPTFTRYSVVPTAV
ncbi:hypothetical protein 2 [Tioga picorna-like virus 1]|uniref:hypothetical protein 2 n=1 Tax=Tioga picorna-like virus 1 TaxID=2029771 RepID=UPI000BAE4342|nr:hypothetical protein 2 [Tioga picorna-like virus 1]ASV51920.1 hypothetical protein 2 [Tioga picorna-like virus 1]